MEMEVIKNSKKLRREEEERVAAAGLAGIEINGNNNCAN
jgi:hypothetical protein